MYLIMNSCLVSKFLKKEKIENLTILQDSINDKKAFHRINHISVFSISEQNAFDTFLI